MDTTAQLPQVYIVIEKTRRGSGGLSSDFTPGRIGVGCLIPVETRIAASRHRLAAGDGASPASTRGRISSEKSLVLADPVLQGGGQFVHVCGGKIQHVRLKDRDAVRSDRVPPYLD